MMLEILKETLFWSFVVYCLIRIDLYREKKGL